MAKLLVIEAFYGGSHKQLLDTILESQYIGHRSVRLRKNITITLWFRRYWFNRVRVVHTSGKEMALEGPIKCHVFCTNDSPQRILFHSTDIVRIELCWIDWPPAWPRRLPENRLLPWESTRLSRPRDKGPRLPIRSQSNNDLVISRTENKSKFSKNYWILYSFHRSAVWRPIAFYSIRTSTERRSSITSTLFWTSRRTSKWNVFESKSIRNVKSHTFQ